MSDHANAVAGHPLIELNPWKPGRANAVIAEIGVPVWAIIAYWQGVGDLEKVAGDYELTPEQLQAALDYYQQNKAAIDVRIEANEPA